MTKLLERWTNDWVLVIGTAGERMNSLILRTLPSVLLDQSKLGPWAILAPISWIELNKTLQVWLYCLFSLCALAHIILACPSRMFTGGIHLYEIMIIVLVLCPQDNSSVAQSHSTNVSEFKIFTWNKSFSCTASFTGLLHSVILWMHFCQISIICLYTLQHFMSCDAWDLFLSSTWWSTVTISWSR